MKRIVLILSAVALVASALRGAIDTSSKRTEFLSLLRNTNELTEFREKVQRMNAEVRKERPDLPDWYWDELDREVSVDSYAQWVVETYDRTLTEAQARELNAIFGDKKKDAMRRELFAALAGKRGAEFGQAVQDFRKSHDSPIEDEVVAFMQSEAAAKYGAMLRERESGQKEVTVRLLVQAGQRVLARHRRPNQSPEPTATSVTPPAAQESRQP